MKKLIVLFGLFFGNISGTIIYAQSYIISTIAGNGVPGYSGDGGPATAAEINNPWGVAVDGAGNIYIGDQGNAGIRKVDASGNISTIAGNGIPGYSGDGGPATAAELGATYNVAVDGLGDVYIADENNARIRMVNTGGIITTIAGNGTYGYSGDGGPATAAELNNPSGIAVDASGNIYIGDLSNARIRKVNTAGIITTIAGNGVGGYSGDGGPATAAELRYPSEIALDATGNIYIADNYNHRIRMINTSGIITTIAGNGTYGYSGDGGPATAAELSYPQGVVADGDGNVYITDIYNCRVRMIAPSGIITTIAGTGAGGYSGDGGPSTAARISDPQGITIDASGNIYIGDDGNNRVRKLTPYCPVSTGGITISGVSYSNSLANPNLLQTPTATSAISGTFYINTPTGYTISGTNVAMAKDAKIIVQSGYTLTITNYVGGGGSYISRLYSCNDMWDGIVVEPGATLIVQNGSIIEDAKVAIEGVSSSSASIVKVTNSILNNNYQDIIIDPYNLSSPYPLTLHDARLITEADPGYSSNPYLKAPYYGDITYQGIYLDNVKGAGIVIGDYTSGSFKNTFDTLNYGIYAVNSNFGVFNNAFKYIAASARPSTIGTAILGLASDFTLGNANTYYTCIVGGTPRNYLNTFNECGYGVDLTNYVTVGVIHNVLSNVNNTAFSPKVGNVGINVKLGYAQSQMNIDNNQITNYYTGINLFRQPSGNPTYNMPVDNDVNGNIVTTSGSGSLITGIMAADANLMGMETPGTALNIQNNNVSTANNACIHLQTIGDNYVYVTNNTNIDILNPVILLPSGARSGILVNGCESFITVANNNNIHSTGNTALTNKNIRGIFIDQSTDILVECNSMTYVGEGLTYNDLCMSSWPTPGFNQNNFNSPYYYGYVLENNGTIWQQGQLTQAIQDIWNAPITGGENTYTDASSFGTSSPIYVQSGSPTEPTMNGTGGILHTNNYEVLTNNSIRYASGGPPACPASYPVASPPLSIIQPEMDKFVRDQTPFPIFTKETRYMSHQYVYGLLDNDSTLLSGDTALQNFYTVQHSTCIGGLVNVTKLIEAGNISGAQTANNSLTPDCVEEQNQIEINSIYLSTLAQGIDTLTVPQYDTLKNIASQCPLNGGLAVLQARSLYNRFMNEDTIFTNPCDTADASRLANMPNNIVQNNNVQVFPNPANSMLNVVLQLTKGQTANICLYNGLGEVVRCETLNTNHSTINTSSLAVGLYYYRITDTNGNILRADKQMIIH